MSRKDRVRSTPMIVFGDDDTQQSELNDLLGLTPEEPISSKTEVAPATDANRETVSRKFEQVEEKVPLPETTNRFEEAPIEKQRMGNRQSAVMPNTVFRAEEPIVSKPVAKDPVQMSFFEEDLIKPDASVVASSASQKRDIYEQQEPVRERYESALYEEERKPVLRERSVETSYEPKQDVYREALPKEPELAYKEHTAPRQEPIRSGQPVRQAQEQTYMSYPERERTSSRYEEQAPGDGLSNGMGGVTFAQQLRGYEYAKVAQQEAQHQTYKNEIITVYSPKGGVGKSTIAKEIALALSSEGPNKETYRVLFIDSDWEFGDVATLFNVRNYPNMTGLVKSMRKERSETGQISIRTPQELKQYLIPYRTGGIENLDLLVSSGNATDHTLIDEHVVRAMIQNFRTLDYDFIIFDNANSIQPRTLLPLMVADYMVLVETLDATTIFETRSLIQTLRSKQFDFNKIRMVFNKVPQDRKNMDITTADVENLFKLKTVAAIPSEEDAARLLNNACQSFILGKESAVSKEIKKLVNSITPCYKEPKKGFFARLFSKK